MSKKQRKASGRQSRKSSTAKQETERNYDLLKCYVRRSACSALAGMGAFGLTVETGNAEIHHVEASPFLQKSLVGDPTANNAYIESVDFPGTFPFRSVGWLTEGFAMQYGPYVTPTYAFLASIWTLMVTRM